MRPRLTVSVIAHDEARELAGCLASVRGLADEVIVVDCASTDETARVARRAGARVFRRPNLASLNVNKAWGVARARTPWVLYLDPDERLTPALRAEIARTIRRPDAVDAYEMPRRNFYLGQWLRHGGQYPDAQRRLFRRGRARFPQRHVHERLEVRGPVGRLAAPFDHHPYPDLDAWLRKAAFYGRFQADFLRARGVRPGPWTALRLLLLAPGRRFVSRYILKLGFLDGFRGFLACAHDALTHVLTFGTLALEPRRRA